MTSSMAALIYASILLRLSVAMPGAIPWMGPMPTPLSLMATAGMSPRPTEAPGLAGIPQELRRRQNIPYPPPANWCGFVNGLYDQPLSCGVGLTCVNSETALGCCTATTGICTALYTTCANFLDVCGAACQANPAIRKCGASKPYCGTYMFPGATYLYNCGTVSANVAAVEFLNDFYVTAIGSTLASEPTTNPFGFTANAALPSVTGAAASTTPAPFSATSTSYTSSGNDNSSSSSGGLSRLAIDGIIVGAALVGVIVFALIILVCIIRRKRRDKKAAAWPSAYLPRPMQESEQQPPPPPKAFGSYQSVPQQDQQMQVTEIPIEAQQTPSNYAPSMVSALSPPPGSPNPRFSSADSTVLSSHPSVSGPPQSYYKPPLSPTVVEVDATMGNPGTPGNALHGLPAEVDATMGNPGIPGNALHGVPAEVDATMGNPGAPVGGHGIGNQMLPGGSPSATEVDSRMNWAVGGAHVVGPSQQGTMRMGNWQQGPVELDHNSRR